MLYLKKKCPEISCVKHECNFLDLSSKLTSPHNDLALVNKEWSLGQILICSGQSDFRCSERHSVFEPKLLY